MTATPGASLFAIFAVCGFAENVKKRGGRKPGSGSEGTVGWTVAKIPAQRSWRKFIKHLNSLISLWRLLLFLSAGEMTKNWNYFMSGVTILVFRLGSEFWDSAGALFLKNKSTDAELLKLYFRRKFIIFGSATLAGPCLLMSCLLPAWKFFCL